jgi:hypothetical protein
MDFGPRLRTLVEPHDPVSDLIAAYFDPRRGFAGLTFDAVGRDAVGVDPVEVQDVFTTDDLFAVTLLDVRWSAAAVRLLLSDPDGEFSTRLAAVPHSDVWSPAVTAENFGAADALYTALLALPEVGRTKATKLMARKRPRFVPIVDTVIKSAFNIGKHWQFQWWGEALDDLDRRRELDDLRPPDVDVSLLRLVDVLAWMRFSRAETVQELRDELGVPEVA